MRNGDHLMSWQKRIIGATELQPFFEGERADTLHGQARALLAQQQATWPLLREAVAGLSQVEYKAFAIKGYDALAQFNPKRIVSTGARVDAATIKQRPCFLCAENLPLEEKGIAFGADYVVLCNPFPVLPEHLVIAGRAHTPQTIEDNFDALLELAKELGEEWFVLYNGARCGASAPDHLHFQACARAGVPLFDDFAHLVRGGLSLPSWAALKQHEYRVNLMVVMSCAQAALHECFTHALRQLAALTQAEGEPLLNLIATYQNGQWTVFIFPRSKHRPACYFAEGDAQLLVSPAAIDLAGVLVVPRPDHFVRITARDLEQIYAEVMLDDERFNKWFRG